MIVVILGEYWKLMSHASGHPLWRFRDSPQGGDGIVDHYRSLVEVFRNSLLEEAFR